MPFALSSIGILLIIVGFQNTYKAFFTQVGSDFTGQGNFVYWVIAIGLAGSVGYIEKLRKVSDAFLFLIIVVMFLTNGGFFDKFKQAIGQGSTTPQDPVGAPLPASGGGNAGSSAGGLGGLISGADSLANLAGFL